jgi:hypothetical protein
MWYPLYSSNFVFEGARMPLGTHTPHTRTYVSCLHLRLLLCTGSGRVCTCLLLAAAADHHMAQFVFAFWGIVICSTYGRCQHSCMSGMLQPRVRQHT